MTPKTGSHSQLNSQPKRGKGKPFTKGDSRINRCGAPKGSGEVRKLFRDLLCEETAVKGNKMSRIEALGRQWIDSGDYSKQARAIELGYGRIRDVGVSFDIENFLKQNMDLLVEGQLSRLADGGDPIEVFTELLRASFDPKRLEETLSILSEG
ncbi:MAG: hypothetical protein KA480_06540 [Anaerolineales bacterium]|nr:hypothetical protein [Anaerolineales bacterium]